MTSRGSPGPRGLLLAVGVAACLSVTPGEATAQGIRGWASTTVRYLENQPLQLDTALVGDVIFGENGEARIDGRRIACRPDQVRCEYYRPAAIQSAVLGAQDVGFTAWGLGLEGLSTTVLVRARESFSGELRWPIYEDPFDILVAYAELRRGPLRFRAGRQEATTGLGFVGFDGGSARYDGLHLWAEAFGGRSLARGLAEPAREALQGIEDFVLDQEILLVGGAGGWRWSRGDVGVRYQREIYSNRSALVSERAALDLSAGLPWGFRVRGSMDYDVPFDRLGKSFLTLQRGLGSGRYVLELEARRYVPYFELNTIWGFFSPVPFPEGRVRVSGGFSTGTGFRLAVAGRRYSDPATTTIFAPLKDDALRVEADFLWSPRSDVQIDLGYEVDWGAAAFLQAFDGSVAVDWTPDVRTRAFVTTFQQIESFRLGDGRAIGGGLAVEWAISDRVFVDGRWSLIRNDPGRGGPGDQWNQNRGTLGLRYEFGSDPGLSRRRRR